MTKKEQNQQQETDNARSQISDDEPQKLTVFYSIYKIHSLSYVYTYVQLGNCTDRVEYFISCIILNCINFNFDFPLSSFSSIKFYSESCTFYFVCLSLIDIQFLSGPIWNANNVVAFIKNLKWCAKRDSGPFLYKYYYAFITQSKQWNEMRKLFSSLNHIVVVSQLWFV